MSILRDEIAVSISATSGGAVAELEKLQRETKRTDDAFDRMGKKIGVTGSTIKAGLVGSGLLTFLQDSVTAYGDAAKAAGELATATGGTVEGVSRMQAALKDAGISASESAGMMTKFTTGAAKNKDLLDDLGVTMRTNADGSVDYADAMVQAVDGINKMGDASQRNQALVALFGRKGATAFQELAASGVSLSESMALISKYRVFNAADVARAKNYDDAMDNMAGSMQGVQFALGEELIPLLGTAMGLFADAVGALTPLIGLLGDIPAPVYLTVAAMVALNAAMGSAFAASAVSLVGTWAATTITSLAAVGTGAATMSSVVTGAMGTMRAAMLANPVTAAMVLLASAVALVSTAAKNAKDEVGELAPRMKELEDQGLSSADALSRTADEWYQSASAWDKFTLAMENWGWLKGFDLEDVFTDSGSAMENFKDIARDTRDELGEYAYAAGLTQVAQKELNDIIAEFVAGDPASTWQDVADAVRDASEATLEQKQATELTTIATGLYSVSLQDAVEWNKRLADIAPTIEGALNDMQAAYKDLTDTQDDPATWGDEQAIAAATARAAIWDTVAAWAESGLSTQEIVVNLQGIKDLPGATEKTRADLDSVIAAITGRTNEIPASVKAALDGGSAETTVDALEDVAAPQTSEFTIDVVNEKGAAWTIDQIARERVAPITVDIVNDKGASWLLDQVARPRTAVIEIDVRGLTRARSEIAAVTSATRQQAPEARHNQTSAAPVTQNFTFTVNDSVDPRRTVRAIESYLRRNGDLAGASVT